MSHNVFIDSRYENREFVSRLVSGISYSRINVLNNSSFRFKTTVTKIQEKKAWNEYYFLICNKYCIISG